MSACFAASPPLASLKKDKPDAMLIESSEGVRIMRNGKVFSAQVGQAIQLGDRVVVSQGASARAVFQEQGGQIVLGAFEGCCDATLVYFSRKDGACSVVFDVAVGKVELSMSPSVEAPQEGRRERRRKRTSIGFHCYSKSI